MRRRLEEIKEKGFNMIERHVEEPYQNMSYTDFNKIRVGLKTLDDAVLDLGSLKKTNRSMSDKSEILRALDNKDYEFLRDASNFFYETSGIYSRLCEYLAYLYRYDWMVTPYINSDKVKEDKILKDFGQILKYLDKTNIKSMFGEISLKVIKNGIYYAYKIYKDDKLILQELPINYCRSTFFADGLPVIEFNMKFFDDSFRDANTRAKVIAMFPKEFAKGYIAFKEGRLKSSTPGDSGGWYVLDPKMTVKLNINNGNSPIFANVIPSIIDLDEAQDLDRKKTMQKLLKIVIQKLPFDKNNELIFDIDEAKDLHNNAVQMLGKAIGVDVLTTFAETEVADLADKYTSTTSDELKKVERTVFNASGISHGLFNTEGNLALEKSILNDEASIYSLLLQFQSLLNEVVSHKFNGNPKKIEFRVEMLPTTIYNYKELSKVYKEHATLGYSKMLPQIALGHSQSSILATAYFENKVLNLSEIMIPAQMSSTMSNKKDLDTTNQTNRKNSNEVVEDGKVGRKEKPDDEKSEKTIQNKESMS